MRSNVDSSTQNKALWGPNLTKGIDGVHLTEIETILDSFNATIMSTLVSIIFISITCLSSSHIIHGRSIFSHNQQNDN